MYMYSLQMVNKPKNLTINNLNAMMFENLTAIYYSITSKKFSSKLKKESDCLKRLYSFLTPKIIKKNDSNKLNRHEKTPK